jgi:hypothetical protein
VTRRCLEDGHFFCSIPAPPPSPPSSTFSSSSSASDRDPQDALGAGFGDPVEQLLRAKERERKERRRERKRKAAKGCKAEFDYTGWSGYNDWRREVRAILFGEFGNLNNFDERVRSKKDCWRDCDFPSECLNEMVREREWRVQREKMMVLEEEWVREQARVQDLMDVDSSSSSSPNDDGDVEMYGVEEIVTAQFYDAEKCSEHKNVHGDDAEMRGVAAVVAEESGEEEHEENLGPLGTDCDGLGEESKEAAYAKCRRKSLDAAAEGDVVASSPLKECAFGFEDVDLGCSVWASEVGKVKVEVDVQMAEVEQETQMSLLSKKVGLGDEDEEDGMTVQPHGAQKWRFC